MKQVDLTKFAALFAAVLMISGALLVWFMVREGDQDEQIWNRDMSPLIIELKTRSTSYLRSVASSDAEEIRNGLDERVSEWVSTSRYQAAGYIITVKYFNNTVERKNVMSNILVPSPGWEDQYTGIHPNSIGFGDSGQIPLIPCIVANTRIDLELNPLAGGNEIDETISYSTEIVDPDRAWNEMVTVLRNDMNGWGSGMARDVEYMLNLLARIRTGSGVGSLNFQSEMNVINEGDVELVFNIAMALRVLRWTGQIPEGLVRNIDSYFTRLNPSLSMDPTGLRPWGEAEKDNFESYADRAGTWYRRSFADIMDYVQEVDNADTGDLLASFLYLKNMKKIQEEMGPLLDPRDFKDPLSEIRMTNQRQLDDRTDPFSLPYHASYPDEDGLYVTPSASVITPSNRTPIETSIDLESGYAVSGREIRIKGLDNVHAWYTNANLERTPESLINRTTAQPNRGTDNNTRCGGVPFPQALEERYFRLQWDLELSGNIDLSGYVKGWSGNTMADNELKRTISFRFPVRVYTWFVSRPFNDNINFVNINEGGNFAEADKSGWVVTPEANATEAFESIVSNLIRGGQETLTSLLRTLLWNPVDHLLDQDSLWRRYQNTALYSLKDLLRWRTGITNLTGLRDTFWSKYLKKGALIPSLDPIYNGALIYDLRFSTVGDRLEIEAKAPEGETRIDVYGLIQGPIRFECSVSTGSGLKVDFDLDEQTYRISGDRRLGSMSPNQPPSGLISLMLESEWLLESGSVMSNGWSAVQPLFSTKLSGREDLNMSISLVAAGGDGTNSADLIQRLNTNTDVSGDQDLLSNFYDLGRAASSVNGFWFGVTASRERSGEIVELERTLWFNIESPEGIEDLVRGDLLDSMLQNLVFSGVSPMAGIDLSGIQGVEIAYTERSPAWTAALSVQDADDLITVSFWNPDGSRADSTVYEGTYAFYLDNSKDYTGGGEGWRDLVPSDPIPLW